MRETTLPEVEAGRIPKQGLPGTNNGMFYLVCPLSGRTLVVIASNGYGWEKQYPLPVWEHVSVSRDKSMLTPSWDEMNWVKSLFWEDEEGVIQLHPPKSEYVNCHPGCLHLWRCLSAEFLYPPSSTVGPKGNPGKMILEAPPG